MKRMHVLAMAAVCLRKGQREKAEELFAKALARNPDDIWHDLRAAEAYLEVPRGR